MWFWKLRHPQMLCKIWKLKIKCSCKINSKWKYGIYKTNIKRPRNNGNASHRNQLKRRWNSCPKEINIKFFTKSKIIIWLRYSRWFIIKNK